MSIKIYGNLTVAGNCSITTNRTRSSRKHHQEFTRQHSQAEVADRAIEDVAVEDCQDVVVEDNAVENVEADAVEVDVVEAIAVEDVPIEDHAIEHQVQAMEPLGLEVPPCHRDQSVPLAQPPRRNPQPRLRRSSRIARRNNLRRTPIYQQRRPLPSALDRDFWTKIWTLPAILLRYLSPGWHPVWCTNALLRQIIWHFSPSLRIPCRTLKRELVELFEYHVGHQYGAYYGI